MLFAYGFEVFDQNIHCFHSPIRGLPIRSRSFLAIGVFGFYRRSVTFDLRYSDSIGSQSSSISVILDSIGSQSSSISVILDSIGSQSSSISVILDSIGSQSSSISVILDSIISQSFSISVN